MVFDTVLLSTEKYKLSIWQIYMYTVMSFLLKYLNKVFPVTAILKLLIYMYVITVSLNFDQL